MDSSKLAVIVTVVFSAIGALGDYLLKRAGRQDAWLANRYFAAGLSIYACTAFGWAYVLRHTKLATVGVVYSVTTVLFTTAIGVLVFKEPMNGYEAVGVVLAVVSFVLLIRFA